MISRIISLFWSDSPKNNFKRIISLLNKEKIFYFKINEILENDKLLNPSLLLDRMERYLRILNQSKANYKLSPTKLFKNNGNILGFGLIIIGSLKKSKRLSENLLNFSNSKADLWPANFFISSKFFPAST